jgi:hypothetical protein
MGSMKDKKSDVWIGVILDLRSDLCTKPLNGPCSTDQQPLNGSKTTMVKAYM